MLFRARQMPRPPKYNRADASGRTGWSEKIIARGGKKREVKPRQEIKRVPIRGLLMEKLAFFLRPTT